jgi:hypothetical protein
MRARTLHHVLVVAALVFGQWLAIAHDYQHPLLADAEVVCQDCVHGHQLQAGPTATVTLAHHGLSDEAPLNKPANPVLTRRHSQAAIRAPPTRLV